MKTGTRNISRMTVTEDKTAVNAGSGTLRVLATPAVIALVEETAWKSIGKDIEENLCTVGTAINMEHVAPTPVGMEIRCETTLTAINGRCLEFMAEVYDECGLVAKGTHTRFIVDSHRFQEKADKRGKKDGSNV